MKQFNKYFTFLGLYIAQSIPMSFFTTAVPVIMRQENYSLELIGLLQLIKLPWILKFAWAPLIDKKSTSLGDYKKWIFFSELFYALVILSIGFLSLETDFTFIIVLVVIAIFASATQDVATDALAILTLKKEQRSFGNAIQSAGGFIGALVGSGALLLIYSYLGWKYLLMALAGFVLLALLPLKYFNYKPKEKPKENRVSFKSIASFFTQKNIKKHILFLILSSSGLMGMMGMIKPYMVDNGYTIDKIGFISGILGTASAAIMACLTGFLSKKIGVRKTLLIYSILSICVAVYFLFINSIQFSQTQIVIGVCALWAVYSMVNVNVYILAMNKARHGLEGTDFTIQTVINQFGAILIVALSGVIAERFTFDGLFISSIILSFITLFYIIFVYKIEG